jgi:hypothetical protein
VSTLEAGYELDAQVAEQVMGWHLEEGAAYWPNTERVWRDAAGRRMGTVAEWSPSTDWGAAGQVVDRFAQKRRYLWLSYEAVNYLSGNTAMHWKCTFAAPQRFQAHGATAPLAICRAALLYVAICGAVAGT